MTLLGHPEYYESAGVCKTVAQICSQSYHDAIIKTLH
jgi:hypothetical protein